MYEIVEIVKSGVAVNIEEASVSPASAISFRYAVSTLEPSPRV